MRPLKKIIDLNALQHNIRLLKTKTKRLIAVVKANAYGHEVAHLKPVLDAECDTLAVACIEEALQLRALGYAQDIILLEGIFESSEIALLQTHRLTPVAHSLWQISLFSQHDLAFWLKIDSGMHRLGLAPEEALPHLHSPLCLGYFSHFACADEADLHSAQQQLQRLQALPADVPQVVCNSAALFSELDLNAARVGLAMYGMSPFPHRSAAELGLRPVMTLKTEIIATRYLKKGETAGYGALFVAPEDGYLATIALGYGDGFNRSIPQNAVQLRLGEALYPLVGRVAMDMSLLWLGSTSLPIGTEVIVFGEENPAERVATQAGTIPYTLTTMLTPRVSSVCLPWQEAL